jgi:hypothetical protein
LVAALISVTVLGALGVLVQWRRAEHNAREEMRQRARAEAEARRAEAGEARAHQNEYVADMNLAQHALRLNILGRARALLDKYRPVRDSRSAVRVSNGIAHLRDWEWRYLWSQCQSDALFTVAQHSNTIGAVCFAGQGRLLAARDITGSVRLWNLAERREIMRWPSEAQKHKALSVAPAGNLIAAGSYATNSAPIVELREFSTQNRVAELPHGGAVISLAFAPDGKALATLASDQTVRVWNLATLEGQGTYFCFTAFSPDGNAIVAINQHGAAHLWRAPSLAEIERIEAGPGSTPPGPASSR